MRFGKKAGTITQVTTSTGEWPRSIRAGETRVRFLAEIADWDEYWEHFDDTVKFFPCTGDKSSCPGCTSQIEKTKEARKRYLAPVLDPKTGKVWGLKMPTDLANRLSLRNDRNGGTITNRDYTLIRTGSGLDTEYDVEQEEKVAIDLGVYKDSIDTQELLASQFSAAWPDFSENGSRAKSDDEDKPAPRRRGKTLTPEQEKLERAKASATKPHEPPPVTDQARGSAPDGGFDEPPPSEPAAEQEAAPAATAAGDDETVEITEDDLRNMPRGELVKLARQAELPITLTMTREQIIDLFLEQFAV